MSLPSKSPDRKRTSKRSKSKQNLSQPSVNLPEDDDSPTQIHTLSVKDAKLIRVTVFNDRAELVRRVAVPLAPGKWDVLITGLPERTLEQQSVRVSAVSPGGGYDRCLQARGSCGLAAGAGRRLAGDWAGFLPLLSSRQGFLVEEVGDQISYPEVKTDEVRKELAEIQLERRKVEIDQLVLTSKMEWLEGWSSGLRQAPTQATVGGAVGVTAENLSNVGQFLEFYCREKASIQLNLYNLSLKVQELDVKLSVLQAKLGGGKDGQPSRTVTVSLRNERPGELVFDLSYVLRGASWTPRYDCRVTQPHGTTGSIDLTYFGLISNTTGEDWLDTELLLSTAKPSAGGEPPTLPTARVNFGSPHTLDLSRSRTSARKNPGFEHYNLLTANAYYPGMDDVQEEKAAPAVRTALLAEGASGTSTTFIIPRRATVTADDKQHKVTITRMKLDTVYSCVSFPRAELAVYRKATMQNNTDFPLLTGEMTVFVNNNLLTTNTLPQTNPREIFFVFVGRDDSLRCKYKLDKKDQVQASTGMVFKARSESFRRTVEIKNTSEVPEVITIYEQIPVPSDDKIKVKVSEPDCLNGKKELPENVEWAKINEANHLEYRVLVPPGVTHNIKIQFTVEWPADQQVHYNW